MEANDEDWQKVVKKDFGRGKGTYKEIVSENEKPFVNQNLFEVLEFGEPETNYETRMKKTEMTVNNFMKFKKGET